MAPASSSSVALPVKCLKLNIYAAHTTEH